jgi:DNA-binding NarL/FixJ family response regulator
MAQLLPASIPPSAQNIRIVLVDDHNLLRAGMAAIVSQMPGCVVVGQANGGTELRTLLAQAELPHIVLMDIGLGPGDTGIELTRWVKTHYPGVKVIGLTVSDEQSDIVELVQAGASGYLLKNTDQAELQTALYRVAEGQNYFSSQVAESLLNRLLASQMQAASTSSVAEIELRQVPNANVNLTSRELDILVMVAREFSTTQIADSLNISPRTVENHRYRLTQKLGVKGAAGLAKYAIKHGLLAAR